MALPDLLEHVRGWLDGSEPIEEGVRGRRRGIEVVFRLTRHSSALWTQVDVVLASPRIHFALREQTEDELHHVTRGRGTDVVVGDADFDGAFVLEAAPAELVRALLDRRLCQRLLALRPLTIEPTESGFRLEKSGWLDDRAVAEEMLDVGAALAERAPAALAEIELQRGSYRDSSLGRTTAEGGRDTEIAAVAARAAARKQHQMKMGCVLALLIVVGAMVLSLCAGQVGGGHIDPNDPAFP